VKKAKEPFWREVRKRTEHWIAQSFKKEKGKKKGKADGN
jgi:hypothetical protein